VVPLGLAWLSAGSLRAQDLPKAEDLMSKYIEATGGAMAHSKIKTLISKGTMSVAGIKGDLTTYQKSPNLMYMEIKLPGVGTVAMGYNGKVAWETNPITGAKIHSGSKLDEMIREAAMDSDTNWKNYYKSAKTVELVQVNGKPAYRVDLVSQGGVPQSRYFDKQSGLIVKMKNQLDTDMGKFDVESFISDYKKFGGVLMPTKIRQDVINQQIEMILSNVEPNAMIPDDRFNLPKEVQDLIKQKGA
jgi:hypothetical protein